MAFIVCSVNCIVNFLELSCLLLVVMTKFYEFTATLMLVFTIFVIVTVFIAKGGPIPIFVTSSVLDRECFLLIYFSFSEAATDQPQVCKFIKKDTLAQVFSCEFCKISTNTFFTEHLRTTASGITPCDSVISYDWSLILFKTL